MHRSALQNLVCPATLRPLQLTEREAAGDDVLEGELACDGSSYAIQNGIPSLLSEDAEQDQTIGSFAQKWSRHAYYRDSTRAFYTDWYLRRYGFREESLGGFLRDKRYILDAGTGSGRDALNFAEHCSGTVYAADTAREALVRAHRELRHPRIGFVHADLHHLPFPDGFFDFINCDQVIHHTPDPRAAFESLSRKLRRGGHICCYVYRKKGAVREFADDCLREQIGQLPIDQALELCEGITRLGRTLARLQVTVDVEADVPILGLQKGPIDLQRLFHWHVMKCFWNEDFDFFTNNIVNFDWYHPKNCFRFDPDEFRSWFAEGWEIQSWDVQEAGISCRAARV